MGFEYHAKERVNGSQLYFGKYENGTVARTRVAKVIFFQNFEGPLFVELNGEAKELHAKKSVDTKEIFEVIVAMKK